MNRPNYQDLPKPFPPDVASAWGEDDFGPWFEISLNTVIQRFRWIPAGEFMMGSPNTEAKRQKYSEDYHQVTLTEGFWLADTACSQALWEAVMGGNRAYVQDDPQNPVNSVSWLDVQKFLNEFNRAHPALHAFLPSEAQWEYACRAGTTTAFSFGDNINTEQVNYDGNHPYSGGKTGQYREKTLPVKALPANPWGLYQMHGNVWEWCQDEWQAALGTDPVVNPLEDNADATDSSIERSLRGGSWFNVGGDCRSAFRYGYTTISSSRNFGFRFALKV